MIDYDEFINFLKKAGRFILILCLVAYCFYSYSKNNKSETEAEISEIRELQSMLSGNIRDIEASGGTVASESAIPTNTTSEISENYEIDKIDVPVNIEPEIYEYLGSLEYEGEGVIEINSNTPYFESEDLSLVSYEYYSALDELGRTGAAVACLNSSLMPTGERDFSLSGVEPSGWLNACYPEVIESGGGWLYNRCHLIGWQLAGEEANEKNLITGTRYLNVNEMLWQENTVADYLRSYPETHVMYRVTPVYRDAELVARGVLIEAFSVEDNGAGIDFCYYCFNIQPEIVIDYTTGESRYEFSGR